MYILHTKLHFVTTKLTVEAMLVLSVFTKHVTTTFEAGNSQSLAVKALLKARASDLEWC